MINTENKSNTQIINEFTKDLILSIEIICNSIFNNIHFTGPTFRNVAECNQTISYNIYPEETIIESIWNELSALLKEKFKKLSLHGEVIFYRGSTGEILDQGKEYFKILKANHFECYLYEPESFLYVRLLHEFDPLQNKKWISIDFDYVFKSAWFAE